MVRGRTARAVHRYRSGRLLTGRVVACSQAVWWSLSCWHVSRSARPHASQRRYLPTPRSLRSRRSAAAPRRAAGCAHPIARPPVGVAAGEHGSAWRREGSNAPRGPAERTCPVGNVRCIEQVQRAGRTGRAVVRWSVAVAALLTLAVLTVLLHASGAHPATVTAPVPVSAMQHGADHGPVCTASSSVPATAAPSRNTPRQCDDTVLALPVLLADTIAGRVSPMPSLTPRTPVPTGSLLISLGIDRS